MKSIVFTLFATVLSLPCHALVLNGKNMDTAEMPNQVALALHGQLLLRYNSQGELVEQFPHPAMTQYEVDGKVVQTDKNTFIGDKLIRTTVFDKNGNKADESNYEIRKNGQIKATINQDKQLNETRFYKNNNQIDHIDAGNKIINFTYDDQGRLQKYEISPDDVIAQFRYQHNHLTRILTYQSDKLIRTQTMQYSSYGLIVGYITQLPGDKKPASKTEFKYEN